MSMELYLIFLANIVHLLAFQFPIQIQFHPLAHTLFLSPPSPRAIFMNSLNIRQYPP